MIADIPDRLSIPLPTAATILFDGSLSARDIAHVVVVGWLAARKGATGSITLPRNELKMAVGFSRSRTIAEEEDRVYRLEAARMTTGGGEMSVPSLPTSRLMDGRRTVHRGGMRIAADAQQRWLVGPDLAAAFSEEDEHVELPTSLLRGARSRWSVPVLCRVLCWVGGWIDPRLVRHRSPDRLVVRLPMDEALERLDQPDDMLPSDLLHDVLQPAVADIGRCCGYKVSVRPVRTRYRGQPGRLGKTTAIEFEVAIPPLGPLVYLPSRVPGKTWERADGPPRKRKLVPEVVGVAPFDASLQFDSIADTGIRLFEAARVIEDDQDIEFGD